MVLVRVLVRCRKSIFWVLFSVPYVNLKVGKKKKKVDGRTLTYLQCRGYDHRFHAHPLSNFWTFPVMMTVYTG